MANYKETIVSGLKWKRSKKVIIDNPLGAMPTIKFVEEDVVVADGQAISTESGVLAKTLSVPTDTFNLIHPESGLIIGTGSYQELYVMMYSLYLHMAAERDAAV